MPLKNARYRWKTLANGKKIRLAFKGSGVVEVKKQGSQTKRVR